MGSKSDDIYVGLNAYPGSMADRSLAAIKAEGSGISGSLTDAIRQIDTRRKNGHLLIPAAERAAQNLWPSDSSFEVGVSGLTTNSLAGSITQQVDAPGGISAGTKCAQWASTGTGNSIIKATPSLWIPVTAGRYYTLSAYLKKVSGTFTQGNLFMLWRDSAGGSSQTDNGTAGTVTTAWGRRAVSAKAPSWAVALEPRFVMVSSVSGDLCKLDAIMVEEGNYSASPGVYIP